MSEPAVGRSRPARPAIDTTTLPRLFAYTWRYKRWLAGAAIGMALYASADTLLIYTLKPLLNGSIVNRDPWTIRWIPIFILALFVARGIAGFVGNYGMAWIGNQVVFRIREDLFSHCLALPSRFFDRHATGRITAQLTYYTNELSGAAIRAITFAIQDSLRVVGFIGLMFWINWSLALITLGVGPIIAVLLSYVARRFRRYSERIQRSIGDITHLSEEVLNGQRVVKIFGGQAHEREAFRRTNEHNRRMTMRKEATRTASVPVTQMIGAVAVALVVALAVHNTGGGVMSPGDLATFFGAMLALMGPIKHLTRLNSLIQTGLAAAEAIFDFLDEPGEDPGRGRALAHCRGRIRYERVDFRYPDTERDVLRSIELDIEPGETVALVGRSGSGKSTLMSLLARFYDPTAGRILLDEVDLTDLRLSNVRDQISLVDQNVALFDDTVAGNIAYGGLSGAGNAAVVEAARRAYADEFIRALPDGYDTRVGQNGIMLSGGQRQRIAIARAALKDAPILLLDEATSALDSESETAIQRGLAELMRDRTTLVIAHRLSTVAHADRIIVLNDGEIVEQGTHADLIDRGGIYRSLYDVQFDQRY